ncbi:MAG: low molecular weight protein arginine phosphatase [Elusimicrobia bacterium]|nr:low molecular weight protein arginine phosphatase [Elusimicrobiota bacterium]
MTAAPPARRYLFVCTGNVCRSPAAESLLQDGARRRGLALEARSRGTAAELHYRMPDATRRALSARGVSCDGHVARLVDAPSMAWADAVLVMTRAHREQLLEKFPQFSAKIFLLMEHCGLGGGDVADPMGRPDAAHQAAVMRLETAVAVLLDRAENAKKTIDAKK